MTDNEYRELAPPEGERPRGDAAPVATCPECGSSMYLLGAEPVAQPACDHDWRDRRTDTNPYALDTCCICGTVRDEAEPVAQQPPSEAGMFPPAPGNAYRARMEYLMQAVAALLREYGLLRCEWSVEGVDPIGRKIKHRIHVECYARWRLPSNETLRQQIENDPEDEPSAGGSECTR